ncbi:DUF4358 domain-containing protein [Lysinibacillus fusiformis]|uniref:DUF4358 domain-containing protein n=1 Tax=Lysinibacillus fusiformis TaxID=28031 RepID=A0A1E4R7M2_9BACI|nr:DUF4358 domain-containing protein [Lysinibacillus fusiformis]ODV56470.1 hypothetical protein BG258_11465 [Lysinibacillus fusiformis]
MRFLKINSVFTIFICLMMLAVLNACSGNQNTSDKLPTAIEIGKQMQQASNLEEMKQGDQKMLQKLYGLTMDEVESFVLYTAPTNIKADEIVVIQVKDLKHINSITEKMSNRIATKSKSFQDYLPEEHFLIEKHILKTNDHYILLAISKDANELVKVFDKALK